MGQSGGGMAHGTFSERSYICRSDEVTLCNECRHLFHAASSMMNGLKSINSLFLNSGHTKLRHCGCLMVVQVCEQPRQVQLKTVWEDTIVRGFAEPIHQAVCITSRRVLLGPKWPPDSAQPTSERHFQTIHAKHPVKQCVIM